MGQFKLCLPVTLRWEGGKSNDPRDPGGATQDGITQATYNASRDRHNLPHQSVFKMTAAERDAIYREDYWNKMLCDAMAPGVNLVTFDAGVNSGIQRALNWKAAAASSDRVQTIKGICARRLSFVEGLKTFPIFGKGWRNRIAGIEATAMTMAAGTVAKTVLSVEARSARSKAATAKALAKTVPAGAGGVEATHQIAGGGHLWLTLLLIALTGAAIAILIIRHKIQASRAQALEGAAITLSMPAATVIPTDKKESVGV
ncbi:glycoside hydrolase family 108 protein [Beijerinckia indica]|uniref:TtsA-like Glycoside hydrolase family 108 domain-containing protein n=1 Tax=Beijerinckia indica subsp. indica (strain ATCC 9039 / DSM 1715 / NCIMB 8712) TaxID=395963 RepID=B2IE00_BEII9|nr:glycosyl hydrolase 108 family protein [Beijerinckia indica]ACB96931.1 protein of unknown function DUF847 [Beijerinckia indica subsp. indica ATCC 9039]